MDTILTAYANRPDDKFPTLLEEDEKTYAILSKRKADGSLDILREEYATTQRIQDNLLEFQDRIVIFHYSSYAGRDRSLLEDGDAHAEGIAALLGECPNIILAVLNGCSTKGQVQGLLDAGVPIVIATSAPVGDLSAPPTSVSVPSP